MERQPSSRPSTPAQPRTSGSDAEQIARRFLEQAGCHLLAANYRTRQGEIDLVMREGQRLLFVEVKARRHDLFGGALASVTVRKQQKIIASARAFLHHHPHFHDLDCRFDVVTLQCHQGRWRIDWLPGAFTP